MVDMAALLDQVRDDVLARAGEALACARLQHYDASTAEQNARRLSELYGVLQAGARGRTVLPLVKHAEAIARERYLGGFDLGEVLTVFNVLEEALWRRITGHLPAEDYPEAFGLVSTMLGAGRQALALQYVALARRGATAALDLEALLSGV